jgi:hypothetical protein
MLETLILAEDTVRRVKESMVVFAAEAKRYMREAVGRGFERKLADYSVPFFRDNAVKLIDITLDALPQNGSVKITTLRIELEGLRLSVGAFVSSTLELLKEVPTFLGDTPRKINDEDGVKQ